MKWLAAVLLLTLTPPAWAGEWCSEQHFGLVTISKHLDPGRKYNEEHWGPYWRCRFSKNWSGQLGWYPNSYKRDTFYGLLNYVPWRWWLTPDLTLKLGGGAGVGTGYAEDSDGTPKGGFSPIVGGLLALQIGPDAHVKAFFNTAVIVLVAEVRWK